MPFFVSCFLFLSFQSPRARRVTRGSDAIRLSMGANNNDIHDNVFNATGGVVTSGGFNATVVSENPKHAVFVCKWIGRTTDALHYKRKRRRKQRALPYCMCDLLYLGTSFLFYRFCFERQSSRRNTSSASSILNEKNAVALDMTVLLAAMWSYRESRFMYGKQTRNTPTPRS